MEGIEVQSPDLPQGSLVKPKRAPMDPKKKKKWLKRAAIALVVVLAVYFLFLRPMSQTGSRLAGSMYMATTAQVEPLTVSVSGSGIITPIDSYKVSALVTGEVLEAPFEEGDWVEKGALLYRLDAGDAETAVQQAQLSLQQAQLHYDDLARNQRPTAGAPGVVQAVLAHEGDLLAPGAPIVELADSAQLFLTVPFLAADAAAIVPGQSAQVTIEGTMETLPAVVEQVSNADLVGPGGALVRPVKLRVENPGALTSANSATATVGTASCANSAPFEPARRWTVVASAAGEVTDLPLMPGTRVHADTVVAALGGSAADSALTSAAIAVESAQLALQRAQDALDHYTITAPISGTVVEKNFKAGDKIESDSLTAAGGSLAVLYDMSTLTFQMNINDLDINKLEVGQPVRITSDALKGQTFTGRVDKVNINGATAGGFTTYPITVQLDGDGNRLEADGLKPGMNINADILVEEAGEVLCLPIDAVGRGDVVQVAGEGALDDKGNLVDPSKLESRSVTLGRNGKDKVEIVAGLEAGETVYIYTPSSNAMSAMMEMGG